MLALVTMGAGLKPRSMQDKSPIICRLHFLEVERLSWLWADLQGSVETCKLNQEAAKLLLANCKRKHFFQMKKALKASLKKSIKST